MYQRIQRELFLLLNNLTGTHNYMIYQYEGKLAIELILREAEHIAETYPQAEKWLLRAAKAIADILVKAEYIPPDKTSMIVESGKNIIEDIIQRKVDVKNMSVDDLALFASTNKNLQLMTMHRAKGREFDAVAIIDLHEGRIPDFRAINAGDYGRIEEDRRRLYVAISRARRFLLYVSDEEDKRNPPSRFLGPGYLDIRPEN